MERRKKKAKVNFLLIITIYTAYRFNETWNERTSDNDVCVHSTVVHRNLIRICCCLFNRNVDDEVILLISDRKNNIQRVKKEFSFTFSYVEIEETQREIDVCLNRKYCVKCDLKDDSLSRSNDMVLHIIWIIDKRPWTIVCMGTLYCVYIYFLNDTFISNRS